MNSQGGLGDINIISVIQFLIIDISEFFLISLERVSTSWGIIDFLEFIILFFDKITFLINTMELNLAEYK